MPLPKSKPRGYFEKILTIDCETTGLTFGGDDPSVGHQAISWGAIVTDFKTLEPVEELYIEVKWNDQSKAARAKDPSFGKRAEQIHGLTYNYLEENGVDEEEAVVQLVSMLMKYWSPDSCIPLLGHNVIAFDMWFLKRMTRAHGINLKHGSRHYDTNTVAGLCWEEFNSDDLFAACGLEDRGDHNALEDARNSLESARLTRMIFKEGLK